MLHQMLRCQLIAVAASLILRFSLHLIRELLVLLPRQLLFTTVSVMSIHWDGQLSPSHCLSFRSVAESRTRKLMEIVFACSHQRSRVVVFSDKLRDLALEAQWEGLQQWHASHCNINSIKCSGSAPACQTGPSRPACDANKSWTVFNTSSTL